MFRDNCWDCSDFIFNNRCVLVLRKLFDTFDTNKKGSIHTSMCRTIFTTLGIKVDNDTLKLIIDEVDADGSGELEFPEFVQLAAQFLIEEDAEEMQNELKEAFRLYDKEGMYEIHALAAAFVADCSWTVFVHRKRLHHNKRAARDPA